jgi:DNA-binding response OmpR family regulator
MPPRVLNVGQCGFDHAAIAEFLSQVAGAEVDAADTVENTERELAKHRYNLVLVNRLLDADGTPGVELIARLRQRADCPPLMLVSNHPAAQARAMAAGALEGFGKATLHLPQTAEHLRQVLNPV